MKEPTLPLESRSSSNSADHAPVDRRNAAAAIASALGLALYGCAPASDGESVPEAIGATSAALSGADMRWVNTVLGAVLGATRTGDLATRYGPSGGSFSLAATLVIAEGCVTAGDGGGGVFYWVTGTATDDGGTIIVPTHQPSGGNGYWKRVYSGNINARWYGVTSTSDLGAVLNKIDTATLGSAPGTIEVPPGNYTIGTGVTLGAGHRLHLGAGLYTNAIPNQPNTAMFYMKDDTEIAGDGWNTVVQVPPNFVLVTEYNGFVFGGNDGNHNLTVRDMKIVPGTIGGGTFGGQQTLAFNNAHNVRVERVYFHATLALCIGLGGGSGSGFLCDGALISDCKFEDVNSNVVCPVNAQNFVIRGCVFTWPGGVGGLAIDCEPNAPADSVRNFVIEENVFDCRNALTDALGINISGGGGAAVGAGVVSNNTFIGEDPYRSFQNAPVTGGMSMNGARDILVSGNNFGGMFPNNTLSIANADRCSFIGNRFQDAGDLPSTGPNFTSHAAVSCGQMTRCVFYGNAFHSRSATQGFNAIVELPGTGCDSNYYFGNYMDQSQENYSSSLYNPVIWLDGPNSRAWMNNLAGRLNTGATVRPRRKVSASSTMTPADEIVGVDTSAAAITVTLPVPATVGSGAQFVVQDEANNAAARPITIKPHAAELINGSAATVTIATNSGRRTLYTDGTNWFSS